jgi:hypothetical protein
MERLFEKEIDLKEQLKDARQEIAALLKETEIYQRFVEKNMERLEARTDLNPKEKEAKAKRIASIGVAHARVNYEKG